MRLRACSGMVTLQAEAGNVTLTKLVMCMRCRLGLLHTFEEGNTGNCQRDADGVTDTPRGEPMLWAKPGGMTT